MTRYVHVETIGHISIVRHAVSERLYAAWYESGARRVRRISLRTERTSEACEIVRTMVDAGQAGSPREFLQKAPLRTIRELLELHRTTVSALPSVEAENIHINIILGSKIADRNITSLRFQDFEFLRNCWLQSGIKVATVSRRLATLRSALNRAAKAGTISNAPHVPEFRTKNLMISAPPKGAPCSIQDLAKLYDAVEEPHLQLYLALLFGTAARSSAVLEIQKSAFDLQYKLVDLNPPGRIQTKKTRPTLKLIEPLSTWIRPAPEGRLIQWRFKPVRSIKVGMRKARHHAGLSDQVNSYSIRHAAGRYMSEKGVPLRQIGGWLGHDLDDYRGHTTQVYAPFRPEYLLEASYAMTDLFQKSRRGLIRI